MSGNKHVKVLVVMLLVFAVISMSCENPAGSDRADDVETIDEDGTENDEAGDDSGDDTDNDTDPEPGDSPDKDDTEDETGEDGGDEPDDGEIGVTGDDTDNDTDGGIDSGAGPGDSPEGSNDDSESEPEDDPDEDDPDDDPEPGDSPDDGNDTGEDTGGDSGGDTGEVPDNETEDDPGDSPETGAITISFDDPDDPEIIFSGVGEEVLKGDEVVITPGGLYTGHTWYLNGSTSHAGLSTDGATATINTNDLSYGTHSVSLVVAEGYSVQFSFDVVDTVTQ